ncbi:hypothetical protein SAMN04490243_1884 [Robiginitalea myxolifaciens]|uniref:Outer membrane protein beta-barrel domain-containing protein n=1 Tax=Robiginitalea myxolifaciens TaxID=400055 RepID=A0A1I6GXY5_9FLAO|nr:hypothetical protein [Robiginitalea myxolifaciens]SFR47104.1 hypothetical protein SAMN04490243_1884 [Robiginitalea myxolifaciens]
MVFRGILFVLFLSFLSLQSEVNAQVSEQGFQVSIGRSFIGPAKQMSNHLEDNGYNASSAGFIFGPVNYPEETSGGTVVTLAYRWGNNPQNGWKVEAFYGNLGESTGQNASGDFIDVGFRSIGFGASRIWNRGAVEFSLGPRILVNSAFDIDDLNESNNTLNTAFAFGVEGGMDIRIWKSARTYGLLGVTGLLTHGTEMGPFPEQYSDPEELEATTLNYSHGTFRFILGVTF